MASIVRVSLTTWRKHDPEVLNLLHSTGAWSKRLIIA